MNNHYTPNAATNLAHGADEIYSSFAVRLGRELTSSERSFVNQLFADDSIAVRSWAWEEGFEQLVVASDGVVGEAGRFLNRWSKAFGAGYQELFSPAEAMSDIVAIEDLGAGPLGVRAYRAPTDPKSRFRFKLYYRGQSVPLADVLAILEPMGLRALVEEGFPVRPASEDEVWVHEFLVDDPRGEDLEFSEVAREFEIAFAAIWSGDTENDGFNRLILEAGATWREAAAIRALARFRQQTATEASQRTQIRVLIEHSDLTRLLLELFKVKFDPSTGESLEERQASAGDISRLIEERLQQVPSIEDDRVLRSLYQLIIATKRTNFFQVDEYGKPKPAIALKIASQELAGIPEPRPFREIFVSGPAVEGVHLRFGLVARGGLRWSDRHDDFRTEVLGLVKAQQVKNAVIVPVGAKGGFVVKGPRLTDHAAAREAAVSAYRQFLSGMLDVTDNIGVDGVIIPPPGVVVHDAPDPYLVVAADKGTASFSDLANELSSARGFWLGDAFASGGTAGYDHKAMGITARGAWEAVKRHFRESGKNIDHEEFSVVGVGDMSGDVFGNGMLLSKNTRLIAAFDHRDIFIDPNPDASTSWSERKRLFDLPGSSWQDYDRDKLSSGGAVYSRNLREVKLSEEARAALGVEDSVLSPVELIKAILRAPVDLLYMGGIGTYVKSSQETQLDVSDKANDSIRIDGREVRARIVGEGANLGFTQAGRIEFARAGGRINTDAIDNSAGVDSSDLEVNIKILTNYLERNGELSRDQRNALLSAMTDDVSKQVLSHNKSQTLILSLVEAESAAEVAAHGEFIDQLEKAGRIDRRLENLPDADELLQLRENGMGLTRPELAVLLAYAKLTFFDDLVASPAPDDPFFESLLVSYFPSRLGQFGQSMRSHQLRREIIATALANQIIDVAGPTFPSRLKDSIACDAGHLATAFAAVGELFDLRGLWTSISVAGDLAPDVQNEMYGHVARAWRRQTHALVLRLGSHVSGIDDIVDRYRGPISQIVGGGQKLIRDEDRQRLNERTEAFIDAGVVRSLASRIALLEHLGDALVIADITHDEKQSPVGVARLHREVGKRFGFTELIDAAGRVNRSDRYDWIALRRLVEEMRSGQERLTREILQTSVTGESQECVDYWASRRKESVSVVNAAIAAVRDSSGPWTLAKLMVASASLGAL